MVALGLIVFLTVHPSARALPLTTDAPFNWDVAATDNATSADNFIDDSDDSLANFELAHSSGNQVRLYTTDLPFSTTDAPLTDVPTDPQFAEEISKEPTSTEPFLTGVEPIDAAPAEATTPEDVPDWTTSEPEDTTLRLPPQKAGKSLMVVLPYSTNNLTENGIQELYTKAPLTKLIANESPAGDPSPDAHFVEPTTTAPEPSSTTQAPRRRKPSRRPHPSRRRPQVPINHKAEFSEATVQMNRVPTTATSVKSTTPVPAKSSVSSPIRDNVKDLLASIGLSPVPDTKPAMPVYSRPTATITSTPSADNVDVSSAAESLTPEMKDILKSIGLLHEAAVASSFAPPTMSSPTITSQPIVPEVDPSSYVQFKPLPLEPASSREGVKVSNDMQQFLASFGLLPNVGPIRITSTPDEYFDINEMSKNRKSKALRSDAMTPPPPMGMPKIDPDMFTSDMKGVLGDLGLIRDSTGEHTTRDHIFNPVEHSAKLNEKGEAEKVIKLLSTIKDDAQAEKLTAPAEPYKTPKFRPKSKKKKKQPAKEKLEENEGPSPLSLDELRLFLENSKNEVKRQQPSTEEPADTTEEPPGPEEPFFPEDFDNKSSTTVASTTTTTTTTTTTESPPSASANADALADSFGGQGDVPKGGSELPPSRPNGLYFLLDWNTFFNVGEEGKNPVKLNFSPRIGDPKRFIPITVP